MSRRDNSRGRPDLVPLLAAMPPEQLVAHCDLVLERHDRTDLEDLLAELDAVVTAAFDYIGEAGVTRGPTALVVSEMLRPFVPGARVRHAERMKSSVARRVLASLAARPS